MLANGIAGNIKPSPHLGQRQAPNPLCHALVDLAHDDVLRSEMKCAAGRSQIAARLMDPAPNVGPIGGSNEPQMILSGAPYG